MDVLDADWPVPDEQWRVYRAVTAEARERGIRFALGGAFAVAAYTGQWRDSKDIDLYVMPEDRAPILDVFAALHLEDYHDRLPYDRRWIARAYAEGVIVDAIWAMANQRAQVDDQWLTRGPRVTFRGEELSVIPAEELIWSKIYVLQRDRCDWPHILNILEATAGRLDWDHLVARLGDDTPLLVAVLAVFAWLCPGRVGDLPAALREQLTPAVTGGDEPLVERRVKLLDSVPWFAPLIERESRRA